jgi:hypothetical protein
LNGTDKNILGEALRAVAAAIWGVFRNRVFLILGLSGSRTSLNFDTIVFFSE